LFRNERQQLSAIPAPVAVDDNNGKRQTCCYADYEKKKSVHGVNVLNVFNTGLSVLVARGRGIGERALTPYALGIEKAPLTRPL
jgi:hypothetical protein